MFKLLISIKEGDDNLIKYSNNGINSKGALYGNSVLLICVLIVGKFIVFKVLHTNCLLVQLTAKNFQSDTLLYVLDHLNTSYKYLQYLQ